MVQITAAIALGLAGSALAAPAGDKRHGLWCPPDQDNCGLPTPTPTPAGGSTVINSKRGEDTAVLDNAKRSIISYCQTTGLCDTENLPEVVTRYIQDQPERRQQVSCMAVGCPKPAATTPVPEKRQDVACMSLDCETPDSLKDVTKREDNNIACMAVGCPKPAAVSSSVKRDAKAQEAALALRDHMSSVPSAARRAVTCMAIGMCDPVNNLPSGTIPAKPLPTPISTSSKRIVTPYKGVNGPQPWIDELQESKKNKRIINPEIWDQITKPVPIDDNNANVNELNTKRVPPPDVLEAIEKFASPRPVTENRPVGQNDKRILPVDFWEKNPHLTAPEMVNDAN